MLRRREKSPNEVGDMAKHDYYKPEIFREVEPETLNQCFSRCNLSEVMKVTTEVETPDVELPTLGNFAHVHFSVEGGSFDRTAATSAPHGVRFLQLPKETTNLE